MELIISVFLIGVLLMLMAGALFGDEEHGPGIFVSILGLALLVGTMVAIEIRTEGKGLSTKTPITPDINIQIINGVADTTYIYTLKD